MILGADETEKALKQGKVETLYLAANCPQELKEDLMKYAELGGCQAITLNESNEELGAICRKPFFISVLAVRKDESQV
ncbi:MAG: ribosomal L7Ae/L30e/S12e/Gadd45 family protein [Candidatus Woesearchaeota archaeon]